MGISYKDAGVDIKKGDAFVEGIKKKVRSTYGPEVKSGVGGFACLYDLKDGRYLAAGTDGVGTKLLWAQLLGVHHTIGIDLVAMCANDILCTNARGLFFMDYLATGKLDLKLSNQIIDGVVEGCKQAKLALIGGETAEMPGMYSSGEYDLAGFAVGEVHKTELLDGRALKEGMNMVAISSSGFHSNGYSLLRKIVDKDNRQLITKCLAPTKIYTRCIEGLKEQKISYAGLAHITGGGLYNIPRISKEFDYIVSYLPSFDEIAPVFKAVLKDVEMNLKDRYQTFNMGMGLCLITDSADKVIKCLAEMGEKAWIIGHIKKGSGNLVLPVV